MRSFRQYAIDGVCLVILSAWISKSLFAPAPNPDPTDLAIQFLLAPFIAVHVGDFLKESWNRLKNE